MAKKALLRRLGDVDVRLLRIFAVVAECGGFAASEFELNISRSTISKHISDLEMRLGMTLCHRGPAGFALTLEGEQVLRATHDLLRALDRFQSDVDDIHVNLTGTLRIALSDQATTNPEAHLDDAIRLFDDLAPRVALEICILTPNQIDAQLIEGALDIGIVPLNRRSTAFTYLPLYGESITLCCGVGHPLFDAADQGDVEGLSAYKYAGFGFNSLNLAAGRRLGLRRASKVQEEEALSLLVRSGRYLGFLADHLSETAEYRKLVRKVLPEQTAYSCTFAAISRKRAEADRKTAAFLECLSEAHPTTGAATRSTGLSAAGG